MALCDGFTFTFIYEMHPYADVLNDVRTHVRVSGMQFPSRKREESACKQLVPATSKFMSIDSATRRLMFTIQIYNPEIYPA